MGNNNFAQSENRLPIEQDDMPYYINAYRGLKDTFRSPDTRFFLFHIADDMWEMAVVGLTSREWLEFCANVYADLPEDDGREIVPVPEEAVSEAAELMKEITFEEEPEEDIDEDDAAEEEEESEEDFSNTPEGREVKAKLKKVRVAAKKTTRPSERRLAEAANVVTTDNKSVTIEGS